MLIPKTKRLEPRPVWRRHLKRTLNNVNPLPLPTDEEKHDAILVLSETLNEMIPGLWDEAHRIFDEASDPALARKRALTELTRLAEEYPGGYR